MPFVPFLAHGVVHQVTRTLFLPVGFWVMCRAVRVRNLRNNTCISSVSFTLICFFYPGGARQYCHRPREGRGLSGEDLATRVIEISLSGVHNQPREHNHHVGALDQREQLWSVHAVIQRVRRGQHSVPKLNRPQERSDVTGSRFGRSAFPRRG